MYNLQFCNSNSNLSHTEIVEPSRAKCLKSLAKVSSADPKIKSDFRNLVAGSTINVELKLKLKLYIGGIILAINGDK